MLHEFLTANRDLLIARCRDKVAKRFEPAESATAIDHGVPQFLEQLVETLQAEQQTQLRESAAAASVCCSEAYIPRSKTVTGRTLLGSLACRLRLIRGNCAVCEGENQE